MTGKAKSTYVARHRQRQQRMGLRRMEVSVKDKDVPLVKSIVSTLRADGPDAERLRTALRQHPTLAKPRTGADLLAILRTGALLDDDIVFVRDKSTRPPTSLD
jgi:hypothetical protein